LDECSINSSYKTKHEHIIKNIILHFFSFGIILSPGVVSNREFHILDIKYNNISKNLSINSVSDSTPFQQNETDSYLSIG